MSELVVAEAATLASAIGGRVVLLTVVQVPPLVHEYAAVMDNIAEITVAGERNAQRELGRLQGDLAEQGIPSDAIQLSGAPIAQILDQADKLSADYIVMGSHGHTALYDLLVGSTTHGVLLRAKCPVVIIPAAKKDALLRAQKAGQLVA